MASVSDFFKKHDIWLQAALIVIAAILLSHQINRPFMDYDEATYAKVVVDTMHTGDISTFTLSGHSWFEKPPLYLWLAIGTVKIFGQKEFAFRLPSIIASIICLWLVFLIVKKLTGNKFAATTAFLLLLFTPPFYYFAKEVRLDSAVLMSLLAALYFYIRGWKEKKYLLLVLPAIAVGFLFKSFVIALIVPILLIYSFCYGEWLWLKSKYLWIGFAVFLALLIPWHLAETVRFGLSFWNDYFVRQVYQRSVSTLTGTNNYYDYVRILWLYCSYWFWIILAAIVLYPLLYISKEFKSKAPWKHIFAPIFTAFLIIFLFSLLRTHLSAYILPAYPFLAIFISILFYYICLSFENQEYTAKTIVALLIALGIFYCFSTALSAIQPYNNEEVQIGQIYRSGQNDNPAPLYSLDWPILETMNYYGGTSTKYVSSNTSFQLKPPFYLVTTAQNGKILLSNNTSTNKNLHLKLEYQGQSLVLLYLDKSL